MKLTVGGRELEVETAESTETVCANCCFAYMGKANKTCPKISYNGSSTTLCTIYGEGVMEYFVWAAIDIKSKKHKRG